MRFLCKPKSALEKHVGLSYPTDSATACSVLTQMQKGFCAYTECALTELQPAELEHFDPRLKKTAKDDILNWHAVIHRINNTKARKIEPFLPLADPNNAATILRVKFEDGHFCPVDEDDKEIDNLIRWIGANKPEVYDERKNHVARLRSILMTIGRDGFIDYLRVHTKELQFGTALEVELAIPVRELLGESVP